MGSNLYLCCAELPCSLTCTIIIKPMVCSLRCLNINACPALPCPALVFMWLASGFAEPPSLSYCNPCLYKNTVVRVLVHLRKSTHRCPNLTTWTHCTVLMQGSLYQKQHQRWPCPYPERRLHTRLKGVGEWVPGLTHSQRVKFTQAWPLKSNKI